MLKLKLIAFNMTETREGLPSSDDLRVRLGKVNEMGASEIKRLIADLRLAGVAVAMPTLKRQITDPAFVEGIIKSLNLGWERDRFRDKLVGMLEDGAKEKRIQAAELLGGMGDEQDIEVLKEKILSALFATGPPRDDLAMKIALAQALLEILNRQQSETTLLDILDAELIGILRGDLKGRFESEARRSGGGEKWTEPAVLLGEIGNSDDVQDFLEIARKGHPDYICDVAAQAIARILIREGDRNTARGLLGIRDMGNWRGRRLAAEVLQEIGEIGERGDMEVLFRFFGDDGAVDVNRAVARAIIEIYVRAGERESVRELLRSDDKERREIAATILAKTGNSEDIPRLERARQDDEASVRSEAIEAIGEIYRREGNRNKLKEMLEDDNSEVRRRGVRGLQAIGEVENLEVVVERLKEDSDIDVQRAAAFAIVRIHQRGRSIEVAREMLEEEGLTLIRKMLTNHKEHVSINGATLLKVIGEAEDLDSLVSEISHSRKVSRKFEKTGEAFIAICEREGNKSKPREMLSNSKWAVRAVGAEAIGKMGSQEDLGILLECLEDSNDDVKKAAATAVVEVRARQGRLGELIDLLDEIGSAELFNALADHFA